MHSLNSLAARAAQVLGGRRCGRGFIARCPVHDDQNPSLSLTDGADGRLLVHCHAGCDGLDVLAELRCRGLAGDDRRPARLPGLRRPQIVASPDGAETISQLREHVAAILRRAEPIKGTLAERYLIGRGLEPAIIDPVALRFMPGTEKHPPSMVALITDFRDAAAVLGLQFTSLNPDGTKQSRVFMKGTKPKGGVIRLIEDAEVTTELGLAEGTETGLAVMTAYRRAGRMVGSTWAALSAGNLARLPVLDGLERLYVYADNDASGTGQRAAEGLAQRWHDAGRDVFIATPKATDWNDVA